MAIKQLSTEHNHPYLADLMGEFSKGVWVYNENMDVSGGIITKKDIDELSGCPSREYVRISGLDQETFEYFIERYGSELKTVYFFKNKAVKDWSMLGALPRLRSITWFHNQKIEKLWDMSGNTNLKAISLNDFTRLKSLDGIEKAKSLKIFSMGDAVWDTTVVDSYMPFADSSVKQLSFSGKAIKDQNLSFLEKAKNLREFNFSPNIFPTEKIIWAVTNFPHIEGTSMVHFYEDRLRNKETGEYDIPALCMVGKGKRKFRADDLRKKEKLEKEIGEMERRYRGISYSEAFGE